MTGLSDRDELEALKAAMRPLEPGTEERRRLGSQVLDHALAYLEALPDLPSNNSWDDVFAQRLDPEFAEAGRDAAHLLSYFGQCVNQPGFTTASPRFMAYIPGGGLFHSGLGDLLAATSNKYSGFASASPGAVRIENATTDWLASVIGYPKDAAGTLTSGGSIANLTAIVAAR
ncbi:MAG: pyridoxal-dependent decarboxylase, partial [Sphingomicrobium sp.]